MSARGTSRLPSARPPKKRPVMTKSKPSRNVTSGAQKPTRKRAEWDSTTKDLTVHKLSKEMLERRQRMHISRNAEAARQDLYEKPKILATTTTNPLSLNVSGNYRPSPLNSNRKLAAIHSALHSNNLQQVLAQSDRTLAAVKDIFGDDPKRYMACPNVTVAPHILGNKENLERTLHENSEGGPLPTVHSSPGGIRDKSVLAIAPPPKPALNDLPVPVFDLDSDSKQEGRDEEGSGDELIGNDGYQPRIDTDRFHQVIWEHEKQDSSVRELATSSHQPMIFSSAGGYPGAGHPDNNQATVTPFAKTRLPHQVESVPWHATSDVPSELSTVSGGDVSSTAISSEWSQIAHRVIKPQRDATMAEKPGPATAQVSATSHPLQTAQKSVTPDTQDIGSRSGGVVMQRREQEETTTTRENDTRNNATGDGSGLVCGEEGVESAAAGEYETIAKMVETLDYELRGYEQALGLRRDLSPFSAVKARSGSLSGITVALVSSVTHLTRYLREGQQQLQEEREVREQLLQTMGEQQNLMDVLSTDLLKLQEENISLKSQVQDMSVSHGKRLESLEEQFTKLLRGVMGVQESVTTAPSQPLSPHPSQSLLPHSSQPLPPYHSHFIPPHPHICPVWIPPPFGIDPQPQPSLLHPIQHVTPSYLPAHGSNPEGSAASFASNVTVPCKRETDVQRKLHSVSSPDSTPVPLAAAEPGAGMMESSSGDCRHVQFAPLPQLPSAALSSPITHTPTLASSLSSPCFTGSSSLSAIATTRLTASGIPTGIPLPPPLSVALQLPLFQRPPSFAPGASSAHSLADTHPLVASTANSNAECFQHQRLSVCSPSQHSPETQASINTISSIAKSILQEMSKDVEGAKQLHVGETGKQDKS